jgi:hypothetical protein
VHRGFTIFYTPPPERVWSFRPRPDVALQSYRSAFQARRGINELLDGASQSVPRRDSRALAQPASTNRRPSPEYGSQWSDAELTAAITAYRHLLEAEDRGQPITKREVVESLMKSTGRTKGSVEMRLQNISAILEERGSPWIDGYKPLRHYTARLKELVERHLPQSR